MFDKKFYSVKHKNKEIQKISSSGGVFTALSDAIFEQNGIIIGGGYNFNNNDVVFKVCRSKEERNSLRGSKYIQGNMMKIYRQIEEEIEQQINQNYAPILFVGTPCQVAALKNYLKVKGVVYPKLILCDLVCHGVPSPGVWKFFFERKSKKIAPDFITFKDKKIGWNQPLAFASRGNKKVSLRGFTLLYFGEIIIRPSCYTCPYSSLDRVGDITLGDHWNVGSIDPDFWDKDGVSLAIINTEKGATLFDLCKDSVKYRERITEDCLQQALEHPTLASKHRDSFWFIYKYNKYLAILIFDVVVAFEKVLKKIFRF